MSAPEASAEKKKSPFLGIALFAAVCLVIAVGVPMAAAGIADAVYYVSTKVAVSAGNMNSQRTALVAIGVGCALFMAFLLGGIALGINFLLAVLDPKPHGAPAAAH